MRVRRSPYVTPVSSEDHRAAPLREAPILPLFCWAIGRRRGVLAPSSVGRIAGACARRSRDTMEPERGAAGCVHICIVPARRRARRIAGTPDIAPAKSARRGNIKWRAPKRRVPSHPSHEQQSVKIWRVDVESLGETQSRCSRRRTDAKRRRNEAIESDIGVGADLFVCWSNTEAREAFDGGWKCAVGARAREVVRTKARRKSARRATSRRASRGVPRGGVLRRGRFRASLEGSR